VTTGYRNGALRRAVWSLGGVLLLSGVVSGPAFADAFLDAIKGEVDALQVDPASQKSMTGRRPATSSEALRRKISQQRIPAVRDMPEAMTQQEFETYLRQHFLGSYAFYNRLSKRKKDRVYRNYLDRPELAYVKEQIKQAYLK